MHQLFFELLQLSLGTRDHLSRMLNAQEWRLLLKETETQGVTGILADGLEKLVAEQRPPRDILLQWIGFTQITESTYALHCKRASKLSKEFAEAGYETCVLKGLSSAIRYPNPSRRHCGDIDIWVILNNGQSREELTQWLKDKCEISGIVWHHIVTKYFDDVAVEVHIHPIWLYNPLNNFRLQRWFYDMSKSSYKSEVRLDFTCTSAEFDVVYQLVHCFHHLLEEGISLRQVLDYYYVLSQLKDRNAVSTIKKLGLNRFAGAMMWVLQEVCGMKSEQLICSPNEKEGKFLLNEMFGADSLHCSKNDKRNNIKRWLKLLRHYPSEVLWMTPWKVWHNCWRKMQGC